MEGDPAHAAEWAACAADAARFINAHVVIDEPHGAPGETPGTGELATVPFALWPEQAAVLAQMAVERLLIFLKARQLGLTWLACAYGLWLCLFRAGRVVLCFSKTQADAYELVRRFRVMYLRLPDWLRAKATLTTDNEGELAWSNGSRVESRAATKGAGRSFAASLVILDEFAFMQYMRETYTAVKPTVDGGGQLFILSTANGEGDLFHELWQKAVAQLSNFVAVFLSWRADPRRTEVWRAQVRADAVSAALDKQEYPETPEEAFQNTGNEPYLPSRDLWTRQQEGLPALTPHEPLFLAGDAATGRLNEASDCFALVGVTQHPARPGHTATRYVKKWQAAKGQRIDFEGTEDNPGPLREVRRLHREYSILQFAYDPTELRYAAGLLAQEGIWCDEVSQGVEQMSMDQELLDAIIQRTLWHAGDEALTEHLLNADRKVNADDKRLRMVKRVESKKIDLAKALSMAHARCRKVLGLG